MIQNHAEIIVDEVLEGLLQGSGKTYFACTCEDCLDSIRAITLNNIKPAYITSKKGEVYSTFGGKVPQNKADTLTEVMKAIAAVAENPAHK